MTKLKLKFMKFVIEILFRIYAKFTFFNSTTAFEIQKDKLVNEIEDKLEEVKQ